MTSHDMDITCYITCYITCCTTCYITCYITCTSSRSGVKEAHYKSAGVERVVILGVDNSLSASHNGNKSTLFTLFSTLFTFLLLFSSFSINMFKEINLEL